MPTPPTPPPPRFIAFHIVLLCDDRDLVVEGDIFRLEDPDTPVKRNWRISFTDVPGSELPAHRYRYVFNVNHKGKFSLAVVIPPAPPAPPEKFDTDEDGLLALTFDFTVRK